MIKNIVEFTKTTLIGGLLVILPVYLSVLLLLKTAKGLMALIGPVTERIPTNVQFRNLFAILIIIFCCFVAGLVLRTRIGLRAKSAFEHSVLEHIPGYALIRGLTSRIAGTQTDEMFAVALVEIEEALVPAFIVEHHDDGAYTVFVPSVPTPAAGAIYILPPERVHKVNMPFARAAAVITKWGQGARDMRLAMEKHDGGLDLGQPGTWQT